MSRIIAGVCVPVAASIILSGLVHATEEYRCPLVDVTDSRLTVAGFHASEETALWRQPFLVRGFDKTLAAADKGTWSPEVLFETLHDGQQRLSQRCRSCLSAETRQDGCEGCRAFAFCSDDPECVDSGYSTMQHSDSAKAIIDKNREKFRSAEPTTQTDGAGPTAQADEARNGVKTTAAEDYLFARIDQTLFSLLNVHWNITMPSFWGIEADQTHLFLNIGKPAQGLSFHSHKASWSIVLKGAKQWRFFPATEDRLRSMEHIEALERNMSLDGIQRTANEYLAQLRDLTQDVNLRPLECLQRSGDLLYLPPGFVHAVFNTEHGTVGMAGQPKHPSLWRSGTSFAGAPAACHAFNCAGFCCEIDCTENNVGPATKQTRKDKYSMARSLDPQNLLSAECRARHARTDHADLRSQCPGMSGKEPLCHNGVWRKCLCHKKMGFRDVESDDNEGGNRSGSSRASANGNNPDVIPSHNGKIDL